MLMVREGEGAVPKLRVPDTARSAANAGHSTASGTPKRGSSRYFPARPEFSESETAFAKQAHVALTPE
jgi:hypothetical protein